MSGSASLMARFLALAFFIVVAMGIYTFMVKTDLQAAQARIGTVEKDLNTYKERTKQYQADSKGKGDELATCQAQTKDLQTQLEAASKRGGKR